MKLDKYIYSIFIAAATLSLGSCSDFQIGRAHV